MSSSGLTCSLSASSVKVFCFHSSMLRKRFSTLSSCSPCSRTKRSSCTSSSSSLSVRRPVRLASARSLSRIIWITRASPSCASAVDRPRSRLVGFPPVARPDVSEPDLKRNQTSSSIATKTKMASVVREYMTKRRRQTSASAASASPNLTASGTPRLGVAGKPTAKLVLLGRRGLGEEGAVGSGMAIGLAGRPFLASRANSGLFLGRQAAKASSRPMATASTPLPTHERRARRTTRVEAFRQTDISRCGEQVSRTNASVPTP